MKVSLVGCLLELRSQMWSVLSVWWCRELAMMNYSLNKGLTLSGMDLRKTLRMCSINGSM